MGNNASQEFNKKTKAEEVVAKLDLTDKVIIVTGGSAGIGTETVRVLAKKNATVIFTCRDTTKGNTVLQEIQKQIPDPSKVEMMQLDLADFDSIHSFVKKFLEKNLPLHVLINNAGAVCLQRSLTKQGHEKTFAINHLGVFLLTNLLLDKLKQTTPSRIVIVSSLAYLSAPRFDVNDVLSEHYGAMKVYQKSKLCNILFTRELNKRLQGTNVTVYTLHPGFISTELGREGGALASIILTLTYPFQKTIQQGAATTVLCAVYPNIEQTSGSFYNDCNIAELKPHAMHDEDAKALWELSEKLTN